LDNTLRSLSRAAAGDLDAHGAELRARLRAGQLDEARLRVAGELGDVAAAELVRVEAVELPAEPREWIREAERWGWPSVVRGVIAAARVGLPTPSTQDRLAAARVEEALARLQVAEAWCDEPTSELAEAAWDAAGAEPTWTGWNVLAVPVYAAQMPFLAEREGETLAGEGAQRNLAAISLRTLVETGSDPQALCQAMHESLLAWALTPVLSGS